MNNPEKLIALAGGETVPVEKLDGSTEPVLVRQLSVRSYMDLLQLMGNEARMVCAVCDRPEEWVDTLKPQAYETLVAKVEALNGDFFKRWVERQWARNEILAPGSTQKILGEASTSPTLSPKSASRAG